MELTFRIPPEIREYGKKWQEYTLRQKHHKTIIWDHLGLLTLYLPETKEGLEEALMYACHFGGKGVMAIAGRLHYLSCVKWRRVCSILIYKKHLGLYLQMYNTYISRYTPKQLEHNLGKIVFVLAKNGNKSLIDDIMCSQYWNLSFVMYAIRGYCMGGYREYIGNYIAISSSNSWNIMLPYALYGGNLPLIDTLLDLGATVPSCDTISIHGVEAMKHLEKRGVPLCYNSALSRALRSNNRPIIKYILKERKFIPEPYCLYIAIHNNNFSGVKLIYKALTSLPSIINKENIIIAMEKCNNREIIRFFQQRLSCG